MYHLVSISSNIVEDSYNEGEGKDTGCGLGGERVGRDFETLAEMVEYMHDNWGTSAKVEDYNTEDYPGIIYTDVQVADHGAEQNGGWMEPTKDEVRKWKRGKFPLYNQSFSLKYHQYIPT